jgi:hypothetical protein
MFGNRSYFQFLKRDSTSWSYFYQYHSYASTKAAANTDNRWREIIIHAKASCLNPPLCLLGLAVIKYHALSMAIMTTKSTYVIVCEETCLLNISSGRSQHQEYRKYNLSYVASETLRVITKYTLLSVYVKSYERASYVTTCFVWVRNMVICFEGRTYVRSLRKHSP